MFQQTIANRRHKLICLSLILTAVAVAGMSSSVSSLAQSEESFEKKADPDIKRFYQLYRRQPGVALSAARQRERTALRRMIAFDERGDTAVAGVSIKLRYGSAAAQAEVEAAGFRVRARIGDIAVLGVAADDLSRLAEVAPVEAIFSSFYSFPEKLRVERIATRGRMLRAMNDAANIAVRANEARAMHGVTGRGVIVGVIDSGLDWRHGDFRKPDGSTRIKFMWDVSDSAGTGPGGLGRAYTEAEINAALQAGSGVDLKDIDSHGTHVTGIAAGNGMGAGTGGTPGVFAGIAPEADLVIVKALRAGASGFRNDDMIAAAAFIRDRAAELNQPFVINLSIGGQSGNRDGSDPMDMAIDNLLAAGAGRHFAISAGNVGSLNNHAGGVIEQGGEVTLPFNVSQNAIGLRIIYRDSDEVAARVVKPDGVVIGPVNFNQQNTDDPNVSLSHFASVTNNGTRHIVVSFKTVMSGAWRIVLTGGAVKNGRYDAWSSDSGRTRFDASVATIGSYETGSPKGVKRAMLVANFVSKTQYVDVNGVLQTRTSQAIGQGATSSSAGPTRDGRLKPNIGAPGTFLMSTLSADKGTNTASSSIGPGGKHYAISGTSMSSPVVAGTIALMLQANRNLTPDQITRIIQRTAVNDSFTGPTVSYKFGYGKLDALAAVKAVIDNVAASEFVSVSSASFAPDQVAAPETIVAGFGANLAPGTVAAATVPLPTALAGVSVRVTDSAGAARLAGLFFISAGQINYAIPAGTARGVALIDVLRDGNVTARGALSVNSVWPGLFSVNSSGNGLGAAVALRVRPDGQQIFESVTNPIDLSAQGDRVFLILFGTGVRGRSDLSRVKVTLGGAPLTPLYAGPQDGFAGLDQVNVELPASLAGRGLLDLLTYVDGWAGNTIQFNIK
ncbi:MAG: S8 family serine peptidase [Blastocatellales bacterium]